ncbi:hypothetical protein QJS04_geneDACA022123 [Acorus gramineus]|uniref:Dicer-like 3 n=1 Tax=Acorus gramineus TaxID=55184 RepID=A0AAV9B005_ACOGR|nr:hypothetical protein QJS04_geneDACA022123 [Acorus gramineus]
MGSSSTTFNPRSYQVEIFEVAKQRNTITVLETGAGKTMIAVMLMEEFGKHLNDGRDKRVMVFLAPTVHLVNQQFEVIRTHTGFNVAEYYGSKGVDEWNAKCWQKELDTQDVMVMTPQILLDALRNAFMTLDVISLLIFDECHRASGCHPYTRIMKEFYHRSDCKPTIFGMTASPVIRKGVSSEDCENQVSELEGILDSKIYMVKDRTELDTIVPLAKVLNKFYHPNKFLHEDLKLKLDSLLVKAVKLGYISPKLYELLQIIQSFGGTMQVLCLIFVERIITAVVVERFMKKTCYSSNFSISHLTGGHSSIHGLTPKIQKNTLDMFRSGKVNLLFTTDVAEEGIDVHDCSSVVRFDLPKSVRSYVQSRGRARQNDSVYILMIERGNTIQRNLLFDIIRSEQSMMDAASHRDPSAQIAKICHEAESKSYHVKSTGASITPDSSVSLIYKYCEKLPRDRYYTPKPNFYYFINNGLYEWTLTLPPNAALQRIVGPADQNSHVAKQLLCFDACKKLHQKGALDDHLLPLVEEPLDVDLIVNKTECTSGAGTTKRKELHGTTNIHALSGSWAHKPNDIILQAYKLNFYCDQETYSDFVLLVESALDDEVAQAKVELFLIPNKLVKSSVFPCGKVRLDADQVKKAKLFHEFFFNGIFGRLFTGSKSSGVKREFLLNTKSDSLWRTSYMYLLLPLDPSTGLESDSLSISWKAINDCVSAVDFLRMTYLPDGGCRTRNSLNPSTSSSEEECKSPDILHLANKCVKLCNIKDMVVLAIHTGRIYSVLDIVAGFSAESPFDETSDTVPSNLMKFTDYFCTKYGIVLQHPEQPLLRLKQSHNPHNLLFSRMPPELLVHVDVSVDVIKSFYLLPSLMHRLESLLLASQLRDEIACHPSDSHISSSLILEAITTLRCCENFSLERLELLGDSVLKYTVSSSLYMRFPEKHEGQLSARRSQAVCNSTLHGLGTYRNLQGYIRDGAFDPRRWAAPGQLCLHPVPCNCGVDTSEVPLDNTFATEEKSTVVGKPCDRGHRWMCSKTISDCVEALIGAYYVGGGLIAAISLMKWLGIDAEFEQILVNEAIKSAPSCHLPILTEIETLEVKLRYKFNAKGLLLEAMTHASNEEGAPSYCYQRLEFLGDSVLDLLITWHLFQTHGDIDPGEMTDLRSASVNNENFAQVVVRNNLHQHLQHSSGLLSQQIMEYVQFLEKCDNKCTLLSHGASKGPKALGDILESIAGAILIDVDLNLEKVWEIFKPLLSPIVTPDKLELPPLRELIELCSWLGYCIKTKCTMKGDKTVAELSVQLKDDLLVRQGCESKRKTAKAEAALHLLEDLKVTLSVSMQKGGPRNALFGLCKTEQWPLPSFKATEETSNFVSRITLHIPNLRVIELVGGQRGDKKGSQDSAALVMLYELEKLGFCNIDKV